ncbi:uncharacterized protein LOC141557963 isoform X1 [Sminthopsis crassicaudata]|uniref:uncharacterized protein LOC141557963 isoform X1 n=1 Tax=Sminthopsis crassicaudata TaxID=9301 RepID=UPI003D699981
MFHKKAFLHHYTQNQVDEEELREAQRTSQNLISDYENIQGITLREDGELPEPQKKWSIDLKVPSTLSGHSKVSLKEHKAPSTLSGHSKNFLGAEELKDGEQKNRKRHSCKRRNNSKGKKTHTRKSFKSKKHTKKSFKRYLLPERRIQEQELLKNVIHRLLMLDLQAVVVAAVVAAAVRKSNNTKNFRIPKKIKSVTDAQKNVK